MKFRFNRMRTDCWIKSRFIKLTSHFFFNFSSAIRLLLVNSNCHIEESHNKCLFAVITRKHFLLRIYFRIDEKIRDKSHTRKSIVSKIEENRRRKRRRRRRSKNILSARGWQQVKTYHGTVCIRFTYAFDVSPISLILTFSKTVKVCRQPICHYICHCEPEKFLREEKKYIYYYLIWLNRWHLYFVRCQFICVFAVFSVCLSLHQSIFGHSFFVFFFLFFHNWIDTYKFFILLLCDLCINHFAVWVWFIQRLYSEKETRQERKESIWNKRDFMTCLTWRRISGSSTNAHTNTSAHSR